MEWIETTGKSLDEAKELALDRLGIGPDDAEFEVLEEPRSGLFGRIRGQARVRARVKPATVRPKQDRRRRRGEGKGRARSGGDAGGTSTTNSGGEARSAGSDGDDEQPSGGGNQQRRRRRGGSRGGSKAGGDHAVASSQDSDDTARAGRQPATDQQPAGTTTSEDTMSETETSSNDKPAVDVASVQAAAEEFTNGLVRAFGLDGTATSSVDGNEIEVRVDGTGEGLGLLIGPGGRTLLAVQDLARVAAQRRLGDHDTRLRVDVAGYREKRRVALQKFAAHVAELVKESGIARSLDPMPSADRKIIHDTLAGIDGVGTRSEGEDPNRRIIVTPA